MDYCSYPMSEKLKQQDNDVTSRIAKMGRRQEIQLEWHMAYGIGPTSILRFLPAV